MHVLFCWALRIRWDFCYIQRCCLKKVTHLAFLSSHSLDLSGDTFRRFCIIDLEIRLSRIRGYELRFGKFRCRWSFSFYSPERMRIWTNWWDLWCTFHFPVMLYFSKLDKQILQFFLEYLCLRFYLTWVINNLIQIRFNDHGWVIIVS